MDEVFSVTTSILAVYLLFRLASFSKNLSREDDEELFVQLTALCSAGSRRYTRVCPRNCSLYFGHANVAFFGATGKWVFRY